MVKFVFVMLSRILMVYSLESEWFLNVFYSRGIIVISILIIVVFFGLILFVKIFKMIWNIDFDKIGIVMISFFLKGDRLKFWEI